MDIAQSDAFLAGLWLIPLLLLLLLAGAIMLVRYWSQRSQAELRELAADIRRLDERYRGQLQASSQYSSDDPEPYGSRTAELLERLVGLEQRMTQLQRQRIALQEETTKLAFNRWQGFIRAPYDWFQLRKSIRETRGMLQQIVDALDSIQDAEQSIGRIPWEVAQQAHQARQLQGRTKALFDRLHAYGIHGDSMETALSEQAQAQTALARVPAYFFEQDESIVLEQADKQRTAETHSVLEVVIPELQRVFSEGEAWEQAYRETREKVNAMHAAIETAEATFTQIPAGVQSMPSRERFKGIKTISASLEATLGRLEVENIDMVAEQAQSLTENVLVMDADLKRAGEQSVALETVMSELSVGLKALAIQVAALRTRSDHPVMWKRTVDTLAALNRDLNALGSAGQPREPEQMRQDLTRAARLNAHYRELARHCQQIEQAHTEWLALLNAPLLSGVNAWLEQTRKLVSEVQTYSPENWPRSDGVAELPGEVDSLESELKRLVPPVTAAPIPETDLEQRLAETKVLVAGLEQTTKRVDNVRQRLSELQETQRLAAENLNNARVTFNQIIYMIHSNALLEQIASQEAERLDEQALAMLEQLAGERKGLIDKLAREVNALLSNMETSANRWLDHLNGDIRSQVESLSSSLAALDAVAELDESVVAEARRVLASSNKFYLDDRRLKSNYRLEALAPEFKRRSDYWQSCAAAVSALAEVEEHVMASYQEADYYRRETQDLYAQVSTWLRQTRDWPPSSVSLDEEDKEIKRLDQQWRELKGKRLRALTLVQQFGNFSAKYQTLAGKIQRNAERADHEQSQIEDLELELNELTQIWENHRYDYRDQPHVDQDIRDLLAGIEHELASIQRQYKQKTKNYQQVLNTMKDLNKRVKYFQVALDPDHALDANGRVIRRR